MYKVQIQALDDVGRVCRERLSLDEVLEESGGFDAALRCARTPCAAAFFSHRVHA